MRIVSVQLAPVALVFAILYAASGLLAFLIYAGGNEPAFILPIGIIGPLFHLNINLSFPRSADLLGNVFFGLGAILSYALTGWITGIAATLCFNFIAQKTGGISAKFVSVADAPATRSLT
jgi:hypothetical protein